MIRNELESDTETSRGYNSQPDISCNSANAPFSEKAQPEDPDSVLEIEQGPLEGIVTELRLIEIYRSEFGTLIFRYQGANP